MIGSPSPDTGYPVRRVGIVGAGYIAAFHLAALSRLRGSNVVAICDPIKERADAFQRRWNIPHAFESLDAMLETSALDVVHVLVPPSLHAAIALRCLDANAHVFVEKPLAATAAEARMLVDVATRVGRRIGVNHNLLFHPAFLQMIEAIRLWWFGRVRHVISCWSVPLRQLQSGQFDHWMFGTTGNIVLEQAVHPLSQIGFLLGRVRSTAVNSTPPFQLPSGVEFIENWQVSLQCERGTAVSVLNFSPGLPQTWLHVIGDDAVGFVDLRLNTFTMTRQSRFASPLDEFVGGLGSAASLSWQSASNVCARAMEMLKFRPDLFTRTIEASIANFHHSLSSDRDPGDAAMAAHLVEVCEEISDLSRSHRSTADAMAAIR